ncbi:MAG TPA: serine/threonine-protein kinase [Planctomycetota bacterium]|nr:serine/threonine-protein kinase [Planctomycetota bacterium]
MRIGPYEVVKEIGRGGAGIVLRARGPDGRERALKVLKDSSGQRLARFERERRLLSSLGESDGFVPLLDAGDSNHGPYIVMPFVPGGTLRDKLRGPLGIEATEKLAREVAAAMARAHERGIVHRDLKPENILFAADGRALVADLGLAKHFDRDAPGASQSVSLSREGWLRGTAGYMSPEQIKNSKEAGPPADVFALGAILYECLAGAPLYEASEPRELLAKTLSGVHEPIGRVRKDTPPELARAIERALASDPAARFADAGAFLRALAKKEPPPPSRVPLVLAGLGAVTVVLAVAVAAIALRGPAKRPPAPGPRPPVLAPNVDPSAADRYLALAATELAACDDDRALADCDHAVEAAPGLARAWAARAEAKNWKDDFRGAIADATRAIGLDPNLAIAYSHRGEARTLLGEAAEARKDLDRAVELDPRCAIAFVNRAGARDWQTDFEATIEDLRRAIEIDPHLAKAYGWRAAARIDHKEFDVAIRDSDEAIRLEPRRYPSFWGWRASAKAAKGDHLGAVSDYDRAIAVSKKPDARLLYGRATEHFLLKDWRNAESDATAAIELDPKNAHSYSIRAEARHNQGKDKEARQDIDEYQRLAPDDPLGLKALRAMLR